MHIFNITLQSVAALLAIGVLGFWIIKRNIIPENVLQFLGILAIEIALPSIVFANIVMQFSPASSVTWWQYPLWWLGFSAVALLLTLGTALVSDKATRCEFACSLFFQNGLFFPFIIISGFFGAGSPYIAVLFIFIAFHPTLFYSTNHLFFHRKNKNTEEQVTGDKAKNGLRLGRILNPVLISSAVAVMIKLSEADRYLPAFIISVFQMLGGMSLPLLMLILGGSLYVDFQNRGPIYVREVLKFVAIKNFVFPLVLIGMLVIVEPPFPVALVIFLQSAVPPITGVPIQTRRHGGNASITNQFILSSFALSVFSVPLTFNLFTRYFPIP